MQAQTATARLFVAIELPSDVLALLGAIQEQTRANLGAAANLVRWSRAEGIHITLQFLGETPTDGIPQIQQALARSVAGVRPFTLGIGGLGAFPNMRRPRVLWVGLSGDTEAALSLAENVRSNLAALGYKADKPFSPHMTVGRIREGARPDELAPLTRVLSMTGNIMPEPALFSVEAVSLMQSTLQAGGSVYSRLARVPFSYESAVRSAQNT